MEIRLDMQQNVPILRLEGKVTHQTLQTLTDSLDMLLGSDNNRLILDLSGVSLLDSAALGAVIACYIALRHKGGKIALVNPQRHVRNVLKMTRVDTFMEIYPHMQEALSGI